MDIDDGEPCRGRVPEHLGKHFSEDLQLKPALVPVNWPCRDCLQKLDPHALLKIAMLTDKQPHPSVLYEQGQHA